MDYQYYTATPQPYQFLGLPPRPAPAGAVVQSSSDDYRVSASVSAVSAASASAVVRSHVPSSYVSYRSPLTAPQDAAGYDNTSFQSFDYHQQPYAASTTPSSLPQSKPLVQSHTGGSNHSNPASNNGYEMQMELPEDHTRRGSNSEDEGEMTPAQSRRKAQNRAAQRAFRERKERHVKDLEAKLASLEKSRTTIAQENERLRLQLQKASTENEILRATSSGSHSPPSFPTSTSTGPMRFSPKDFYSNVLHAHENKTPSHRIVTSESGERLLAAGATWEFIIRHPLFEAGKVDVGDVSERLKTVAKCDGQGPVFQEGDVLAAIQSSVASGSDELL